jgi:hypothetical protein
MDLDAQRLVVRRFFAENYVNLFESLWYWRCMGVAPTFEKIASVEVESLSPFKVQIKKIGQKIPQSVSDAFARHLWYSQWNFANLFLVKVPIDGQSFFILFHVGITEDAWDNDTHLVEIFAEQGEFVFCYGDTEMWGAKQFTHKNCRNGKTNEPPPPWSGDDPDAVYYGEPLWTEDMLRQEGAEIEEEGTVIRYLLV